MELGSHMWSVEIESSAFPAKQDAGHPTKITVLPNTFTKRSISITKFSQQIMETNCNITLAMPYGHCRCWGQRTNLIDDQWPKQKSIPVHSRGIWNGINFKMAPGLSFIDRVSKNFHSVEVRHRKDYCSLCALGICCQARLGGPKRSIDADKFRFVKAENDNKIRLFVQAVLVLTSNSNINTHFCMRHDAQSIGRLWHSFEDILCHRWPVRNSWFPRNVPTPLYSRNPSRPEGTFPPVASTYSLDDHIVWTGIPVHARDKYQNPHGGTTLIERLVVVDAWVIRVLHFDAFSNCRVSRAESPVFFSWLMDHRTTSRHLHDSSLFISWQLTSVLKIGSCHKRNILGIKTPRF